MKLIHTSQVPEASDVLWKILTERSDPEDANTNISHTMLPRREDHDEFVENHPFRSWWLIEREGEWIGQIRLSWRNEIGVGLLRKYRGRGLGEQAVQELLSHTKPSPEIKSHTRPNFIANINPANERSKAMFQKLGFKLIQETYILESENAG